jgi:hypothetical protein
MIVQIEKGDIWMASQVMEMEVDRVEGMLMVKQKNSFCSFCCVGFQSPGVLVSSRVVAVIPSSVKECQQCEGGEVLLPPAGAAGH